MIQIQAIPALGDNLNYIWLIQASDKNTVLIVDPGEAKPVIAALTEQNLQPIAILNTHRHWDHVDGIAELVDRYGLPVYGPKNETIPCRTHPLTAADTLTFPDFPPITILDIPGHTEGHIAYLMDGHLFCGDTLFGAGCGRLLGGTAEQLFTSLQQIKSLSMSTKIYCAHEYTADNLRFATMIEPDNNDITQRIADLNSKPSHPEAIERDSDTKITLPSTLELETRTNPFLRCHFTNVRVSVESHTNKGLNNYFDVFTALRDWRTKL